MAGCLSVRVPCRSFAAVRSNGAEIALLREYREVLDGPGYFPYYMLRMSYAFDSRGK